MSETISADADPAAPTLPAQAAAPRFEAGAKIGRYVILEQLGAGGMGVVYAARDPELRRDLAIKVLHPGWLAVPEARARFLREAQTMAQLSHPNLVPIWDVGTIGDQLFLAMPKLDGGTLRAWLGTERRWPEVLALLLAAGRGLAAAHQKGIVHRDFKPENVLIGDDGVPRVADFGIAQSIAEASDPAGTPRYMAPEQSAGAALDARCDQYSFAIVMREALIAPPRWLAKIVARGQAQAPDDRWPSLGAMMDAIAREERRRRGARIAVAAVLVLGIAAAGIAMLVRRAPGTSAVPDLRPVKIAYYREDNHERTGSISPDGATLAFSSGTTAWLETRATGVRTDLRMPDGVRVDQIVTAAGVAIIGGVDARGGHGLWKLAPDAAPVLVADATESTGMALRDDGAVLAIWDAEQLRAIALASGTTTWTMPLPASLTYAIAWSPDGSRLALVHDDHGLVVETAVPGGAVTPVLHEEVGGVPLAVTWPAGDRVVISMTTPQTTGSSQAFLLEVGLDGRHRVLIERDAEMLPYLVATPDGLFVESVALASEILTGPLTGLRDDDQLTALATGSRNEWHVAGWTDDGRVLFGTWRGDTVGAARQSPGGALELISDTPADDVPAAIVDGDLIALRRSADGCAIARGDRVLAQLSCDDLPTLVCADARPPCLLARGMQGARTYAPVDLATGAIGAPVYTDAHPRATRVPIPALAPGGQLLAIAHFESSVELIDLATGSKRVLEPGGGVRIQCVGWMPDASALLATDAQEASVSLGRLSLDGRFERLLTSETRWYCDPRVSRDGASVATLTGDLSPTYWLYEGYRSR